jgi:predicted PurR-regulated permease PerM
MKNFLNYLKLKIPKLPERKVQTGDIFADEEIVAPNTQGSNYKEYRWFWLIGVVVVAIGMFLYNISDWVLLIFTGIIISIALESMITWIEKKTRRRWLGILLSYLFLIGLLVSGILVMIPFLINQIGDAVAVVVKHAKDFEGLLKTSSLQEMITGLWGYSYLQTLGVDLAEPKYLQQIQSILQNNISAIIGFSTSYAKGAGGIVVDTVGTFLNTLVQIGFVLTLSVLLSIERNAFVRFLYRITGNSPVAHKKIALLYKKLGFWLKTQLLLGLYIGITMYAILWILALFGIDIPSK